MRGSCEGCAAQGVDVGTFPAVDEAVDVSLEHAGVREQVVSQGDGLSDLEVGEARHDGLGVFVTQVCEVFHHGEEKFNDDVDVFPGVETQVCDDLIVSTSTSV